MTLGEPLPLPECICLSAPLANHPRSASLCLPHSRLRVKVLCEQQREGPATAALPSLGPAAICSCTPSSPSCPSSADRDNSPQGKGAAFKSEIPDDTGEVG